jgi:hypothetical protein
LRLKGHVGLWLVTLAGLLPGADLPGWLLWTPLALAVALTVYCAARLPRLVAPAVALAMVAALAVARAPWAWTSLALALAVGSATLGAATRSGLRPGIGVLLASVPVMVWVTGFHVGPGSAALEQALRAESARTEGWWMQWAARQALAPDALRETLRRVTDTMVLLLPTISLVQVVPLMAWGYSLAHAALEGTPHEVRPLPRLTRVRFPDGAVWVLCLGVFLLVTRQAVVYRAGANLIAFMAAAYFCQGISVIASMAAGLRNRWLATGAMLAVALLVLLTPFGVFACVLGLSDVWLDYRRLQMGPEASGIE